MQPPASWGIWRINRKSPYQDNTIGAPENAVMRFLKGLEPIAIVADLLIAVILVARIVLQAYHPDITRSMHDGVLGLVFDEAPTGGVLLTSMIAALLISARLATLNSDMAQSAIIKNKEVREERKNALNEQRKVCKTQRSSVIQMLIMYLILVSIPSIVGADVTKGAWRWVVLAFLVVEFLIPILNAYTFSIVEEGMKQGDFTSAGIYQSNNVVLQMLRGIGQRALSGTLTKTDRKTLKRTNKADLDGALDVREDTEYGLYPDKEYTSLRQIITGVRDGDALSEEQQTRYDRAMNVARRIRNAAKAKKEKASSQLAIEQAKPVDEQDDNNKATWQQDIAESIALLKQFTRLTFNQLAVTEEMAGRITAKLSTYRPRMRRKPLVALSAIEPVADLSQVSDNIAITEAVSA